VDQAGKDVMPPRRIPHPHTRLQDSATILARNAASCVRRSSPTISIRGATTVSLAATVAATVSPFSSFSSMPTMDKHQLASAQGAVAGRLLCGCRIVSR
jgi:hypothetical protein